MAWRESLLTIFVIEDDPLLGELFAELLRSDGHEVTIAHDVPDTIPKADRIIVDVTLPSGRGLEWAAEAKHAGRTVIVTTAHTGEITTHGLRLLTKPFTLESLREAIA